MKQYIDMAGCRIVLALLVSHRAKLWASTITHPCVCGRWGRCIVQRLCATVIVHPLHVYERSVGFASCETLGVHFIRHPCLTRKMRVLPPAAPKNSTPLVERGAIFGADGGGRTRTVLLPTDFELFAPHGTQTNSAPCGGR